MVISSPLLYRCWALIHQTGRLFSSSSASHSFSLFPFFFLFFSLSTGSPVMPQSAFWLRPVALRRVPPRFPLLASASLRCVAGALPLRLASAIAPAWPDLRDPPIAWVGVVAMETPTGVIGLHCTRPRAPHHCLKIEGWPEQPPAL